MKKTALLIGIVLGVALEVLVLVNAQDTRKKVSEGGDIFHNQVDGLPMNVGGEKRMLAMWTTKIRCVKCGEEMAISGEAGEAACDGAAPV